MGVGVVCIRVVPLPAEVAVVTAVAAIPVAAVVAQVANVTRPLSLSLSLSLPVKQRRTAVANVEAVVGARTFGRRIRVFGNRIQGGITPTPATTAATCLLGSSQECHVQCGLLARVAVNGIVSEASCCRRRRQGCLFFVIDSGGGHR